MRFFRVWGPIIRCGFSVRPNPLYTSQLFDGSNNNGNKLDLDEECVVQGYVKLSKYNESTLVLLRYSGTEGVYKITQNYNKAFTLKS